MTDAHEETVAVDDDLASDDDAATDTAEDISGDTGDDAGIGDETGDETDTDELDLTEAASADEVVDEMFGYGSAEEALTDAVTSLERVTAERDEYLDLARRVQAEFENYKRRIDGQRNEQLQRAAERLVIDILPVLDACEAALGHGAEDVGPIYAALFGTLSKQGLAKVDDVEVMFDPEVHEAVLTEAGEEEVPMVTEIMRTGYSWNGRVVRPAMVKVRG